MMRLAILGATSQIARDLVVSFARQGEVALTMFARRPTAVSDWLDKLGLAGRYASLDFAEFSEESHFDAIINFVGVGNPVEAVAMGASIFDVTLKYDEMALNYVRRNSQCRYLFLSSGAVYGSGFEVPADADSAARIAINDLQPRDWYGVAKLHAECRHRSLASLPIVDIRVFNYFSHTQDLAARFFISDCLRAIRTSARLIVSPENILRDYIGPEDFFRLVLAILGAAPANATLDCYTKGPVDKFTLLASLQENFGLSYDCQENLPVINATGAKHNYYSINHRAETFGYLPLRSSLDNVLAEARLILEASLT